MLSLLNIAFFNVQASSQISRRISNRYQSAYQKTPNILFIMVDEYRNPVVYEDEELRQWQRDNLKTMTFLQDNGVSFNNHYCGSVACNPSRATLFTGQYPSLHGVSQTTGAAKIESDPTMYWLGLQTVPTMGNLFQAGNYDTYYIGKWHVSRHSVLYPGTQDALLSFDELTGVRIPFLENIYKVANVLAPYGFGNGWVGPEPDGNLAHQSGASAAIGVSGRDVFFADEAVELLHELDSKAPSAQPWLIVCSFDNPHDICLYGDVAQYYPFFKFEIDESLPTVPPAPTANEDLSTKPIAQASYKEQYPNVFQPTTDTETLRKLYYTLQRKVDDEAGRVLAALQETRFYNNTIVIYSSDHGSLVGAHGLQQKWMGMYEEAVHIPLVFYSPTLLPHGISYDLLTTHVDVLPTFCGLAGIDYKSVINELSKTFTHSKDLVGKDLSSLILGTASIAEINALKEPVLFQTFDQVFTGAISEGPLGTEFTYIAQPTSVEAVITEINGQIWKLAQYFEDNEIAEKLACSCSTPVTPADPAIEYEMYNLADDPYEERNLANPMYATDETIIMQNYLINLLEEQLALKTYTSQDSLQ